MERPTDGNLLGSERSRASGNPPLQNPQFQSESKHPGPSTQNSSFTAHGSGSQYNAPRGTQSISTGNGPQFPGANFQAPVYFGTKEQFDLLRECLRSLAFPEMNSRFNDIDAAAQGTCEWLLLHETYKSWTACDRGLLWIKGKPGSGKSTLLGHVLRNVAVTPTIAESDLILSFFFHGRGADLQRTPLGLFQSLLHQLLLQVPEALTDLVATFRQRCESIGKPGEKWQWHPRELPRFFESSLPKVLGTRLVWLFVDALDECGKENAVNLAEYFKSLLQRLPSSGLKQSRICFTCRHYPILVLDCVFEICVEKENRKDISTFVQDKLSSFRGPTSSTIRDLVTNRADGVFMWAWLVVKQVLDLEREGAGLTGIEAKIRSVPQELNDLYRELIRNMGSDSLKLIQWICFATRPLSLDELRWALVIDADCRHQSLYECQSAGDYTSDDDRMKRRVQTLSCGLAEVTLSSGDGDEDLSEPDCSSTSIDLSIRTELTPSSHAQVVQFIHQSVKDFFVEKGLSDLDNSVTSADTAIGMAHFRLSRICTRYLAMEEIDRSTNYGRDKLTIDFPFLHYATTSWVAHMRQSDARSVTQEDLLEYFPGLLNTLMERWVRIYRILDTYSDNYPPEGTSLVHIMSRYGVAGVLWAILERVDQVGINIDGKDSHGQTPLWWAAGNGHEAVVRLILDRSAHIEAADEGGRTPLWRAAENGHEAVMRLLLDRGADTEATDKRWGLTPLLLAAENGHEAVVRLLLDRGANTKAADMWGRTPLSRAAENGHEAIMRLLLDRGADTEAADMWGRTPLWWAAENGHEAVVGLLLDRDAHTEATNQWGSTPLWRAAENGHEAVVRLLQFHSAQPSSTTSP